MSRLTRIEPERPAGQFPGSAELATTIFPRDLRAAPHAPPPPEGQTEHDSRRVSGISQTINETLTRLSAQPFGWAAEPLASIVNAEPTVLADLFEMSQPRMHLLALALAHLQPPHPQKSVA